jgi:ABC-type nitrate/sulfonate/bicarbonate transport system substrate-binding protein
LQFYWLNTLTNGNFLAKNKELVDNVQMGILEGMKFMLLNPQEAMERHTQDFGTSVAGVMASLVTSSEGMRRASQDMANAAEAVNVEVADSPRPS